MIYPELYFKITKKAWRERIQFTQNIKKMIKNRLNYLISQQQIKLGILKEESLKYL